MKIFIYLTVLLLSTANFAESNGNDRGESCVSCDTQLSQYHPSQALRREVLQAVDEIEEASGTTYQIIINLSPCDQCGFVEGDAMYVVVTHPYGEELARVPLEASHFLNGGSYSFSFQGELADVGYTSVMIVEDERDILFGNAILKLPVNIGVEVARSWPRGDGEIFISIQLIEATL